MKNFLDNISDFEEFETAFSILFNKVQKDVEISKRDLKKVDNFQLSTRSEPNHHNVACHAKVTNDSRLRRCDYRVFTHTGMSGTCREIDMTDNEFQIYFFVCRHVVKLTSQKVSINMLAVTPQNYQTTN